MKIRNPKSEIRITKYEIANSCQISAFTNMTIIGIFRIIYDGVRLPRRCAPRNGTAIGGLCPPYNSPKETKIQIPKTKPRWKSEIRITKYILPHSALIHSLRSVQHCGVVLLRVLRKLAMTMEGYLWTTGRPFVRQRRAQGDGKETGFEVNR